MRRYWCFITSPENWEICKKNGCWGLDYRYYVTLKKFVVPGDRAVVYSYGKGFVADVEVIGSMYEDFVHIGWTKKGKEGRVPYLFPYRLKIRVLNESRSPSPISATVRSDGDKAVWSPSSTLMDELVFITDKANTWNVFVQVSMALIGEEDYNTIANSMRR